VEDVHIVAMQRCCDQHCATWVKLKSKQWACMRPEVSNQLTVDDIPHHDGACYLCTLTVLTCGSTAEVKEVSAIGACLMQRCLWVTLCAYGVSTNSSSSDKLDPRGSCVAVTEDV